MAIMFRPRGIHVHVVRQAYSPEKKRGVQTMLGSLSPSETKVPETMLEGLTEAELQQVREWEDGRKAETERQRIRFARVAAVERLTDLASSLDTAETPVPETELEALSEAVRRLKLAIRRARRRKPSV